ncbi:GNAT family N-acetyltransferase [Kineosporia sp. A_224]|uniref:GNAT family N-acetyltransferase n=1 Tax=Kineosporia sp. A_224 TaxID=1962180 RepID=UPI001E64FA42|nr:GNAT family N-acetyltransferase [Kineosporia sp. A_224]
MIVRRGDADDAVALGRLRLRAVQHGSTEVTPDGETFVAWFADWFRTRLGTHVPFVAEEDGTLVAVAWLALAERVPGQTGRPRLFGDVQAVYVVPEARGRGMASAVVRALLADAAATGLEHVTVHANEAAAGVYRRAGFEGDAMWLRWAPAP